MKIVSGASGGAFSFRCACLEKTHFCDRRHFLFMMPPTRKRRQSRHSCKPLQIRTAGTQAFAIGHKKRAIAVIDCSLMLPSRGRSQLIKEPLQNGKTSNHHCTEPVSFTH